VFDYPEITIKVRFLKPEEGGRTTPVGGIFYACPIFIHGEGFDCRLLLDGRILGLGEEYEVPVKFLFPDLALPKMDIEGEIFLWEGRIIASGNIVKKYTP
jgi:hypothetical protein